MIDLTRTRGFGALVADTVRLGARHWRLFGGATLVVVIPYVLVVRGVLLDGLAHGGNAHPKWGSAALASLGTSLVIPAMITALHVTIVTRLAQGAHPTLKEAMGAAADRLVPAFLAIALYTLVILLGFLALVIPGIWLSVRFQFAAQAAVVDEVSGPGALRRSAAVVDGSWWRVFAYILIAGFLTGLLAAVIELPADSTSGGVPWALLTILGETVTLSLSAIFATLLFFELRARRGLPVPIPPMSAWSAPERPDAA